MKNKGKNKITTTKKYNKNVKVLFASVLTSIILLLSVTFAWFYYEVELPFSQTSTGSIGFVAKSYDCDGNLISTIYDSSNKNEDNPSATKNLPLYTIEEWGAGDATSMYISIETTGSLDMDYALSFTASGDDQSIQNLGAYWYRVTIINENSLDFKKSLNVNGGELDENYQPIDADYSLVLNDYANKDINKLALCNDVCVKDENNNVVNHICTEYLSESSNMITINRSAKYGSLSKDKKRVIIRVDFGVCESATAIRYTQNTISLSGKIYATQKGAIDNPNGIGKTFYATDEDSFKDAINKSLPGDNILLSNDVVCYGDVVINKAVNLYTNTKDLTIYGNLVYDYVSYHNLAIDLSAGGNIYVLSDPDTKAGGDVNFNTPNSQVSISSVNFISNIYVENEIFINPTNASNTYGMKIHDVNFLNPNPNVETIYKTIYVDSDSILTVEKGVNFDSITSKNLASNIQIINRGTINNIELKTMKVLDEYTSEVKFLSSPQIVIDNYNIISGGIYLPIWAMPYQQNVKINDEVYDFIGNTKIIRQWGASLIILLDTPSTYSSEDIIDYNLIDTFVREIDDDETRLQVYYKDTSEGEVTTIKSILESYFEKSYSYSGDMLDYAIKNIQYMEVYTLEGKVLLDSDLQYINTLSGLQHLDLRYADIVNNTIQGTKNFANNSSIKKMILPETLEKVEQYGIGSTSIRELVVPSYVYVQNYGFRGIPYIYCESATPILFQTPTLNPENIMIVPEAYLSAYRTKYGNNRAYPTSIITDDGNNTVRKINDGYELVFSKNSSSSITAGSNIVLNGETIKITRIGSYAFYNNSQEFELKFDDSVVEVGEGAFYSRKVTSVDFNKVTTIGNNAFYNCTVLTSTKFKDVKIIGDGAFYNCLKSVFEGFDSIESVGVQSFSSCSEIKVLDAPNLKTIGNTAFSSCKSLVIVNIPSCQTIGTQGFATCSSLTEISFKDIRTIGTNGFQNVSSLKRMYFYSDTLENYSPYNFSISTDFKVFVKEELRADILKGWSYLNESRVHALGDKVGVYNLEVNGVTVELGEYVVSGNADNAFISTCNIPSISGKYEVPSTLDVIDNEGNTITKKITRVATYAYYYNEFLDVDLSFGENIETIDNYAFSNKGAHTTGAKTKVVKTLDLNNVKTIGNYVFEGYDTITTLEAKELISIGNYAFYDANSLVVLNIPNCETIGSSTFYNATSITKIIFADLKSIGANAFYNVKNVREINIISDNIDELKVSNFPTITAGKTKVYVKHSLISSLRTKFSSANIKDNSLISPLGYKIGTNEITVKDVTINLGEYVVYDLEDGSGNYGYSVNNLALIDYDYVIPESVYIEELGESKILSHVFDYAFYHTSFGEVELSFSDEMKSIGTYAFATVSSLDKAPKGKSITNIDFGGIETIASYGFIGNTYQFKIIDSENLVSIGSHAFRENGNIVVLNIPNVKTISGAAFYQNPNIASITFGQIESIGADAFNGSSKIYEIYFLNDSLENYSGYTFSRPTTLNVYVKYDQISVMKAKWTNIAEQCIPLGEKVGTYEVTVNGVTIDLGEYMIFDRGNGYEISIYIKPTIDEDYHIDSTVTSIDTDGNVHEREITGIYNYAFLRTEIGNIDLSFGDTITDIGTYAFASSSASYTISKPKYINYIDFGGVKNIGRYAFENCNYLIGFNKDNNLEHLAIYSFTNCKSLIEICLPNIEILDYTNGSTGNEHNTFTNAYSVVRLIIGKNFSGTWGNSIITSAKNLKQLVFECEGITKFSYVHHNIHTGYNFSTCGTKVYMKQTLIPDIKTKTGNNFTTQIEPYLYEFGSFVGDYFVEVETEFAGTHQVNIGKYCINNVTLEDGTKGYEINSVNYSEDDTFVIPTSIEGYNIDTKELFVEDYVVKTGYRAFAKIDYSTKPLYGASKENLVIPDTLIEIGSYSFSGSFVRVSDLNNVKYVRDYAFYNCDNIYIIKADKLEYIATYSFNGMDNLLKFEAFNLTTAMSNSLTACPKLLSVMTNVIHGTTSFFADRTSLQEFSYALDPNIKADFHYSVSANLGFPIITAEYNAYDGVSSYANLHLDYSKVKKAGTNIIRAYDAEGNEIYNFDLGAYYINNEGTEVEIKASLLYDVSEDCVIPSVLDGRTVTSIGNYAFVGNGFNGNQISFANTITSIGDYAFQASDIGGVLNLNNITTIGTAAFMSCSKITSIVAPKLKTLSSSSFRENTSLVEAYLPEVTTISAYSFLYCSSIKVLRFNSIPKLGTSVGLTNTMTIIIQKRLEGNDVNTTNVSQWLNISYLGYNNTGNDPKLNTFLVPYVDLATYQATNLSTAKLSYYGVAYDYTDINGNQATYLLDLVDGNYVVLDIIAPGVISLVMPETYLDGTPIVSINEGAFTLCGSLENFTLSANFKYYVDNLFTSASAIRNIYVDSNSTNFASDNGVLYSADYSELIYYPSNHSGESFTIRSETTIIGTNAFYGNNTLVNLTITDNVVLIGENAFANSLIGSITFESTSVPYMTSSNVFNKENVNLVVYVDADVINEFKNNKALFGINVQVI